MRRVGIGGLGLIGGSLAKAAREKTDACVLGCDIDRETVALALRQGVINGELTRESLAGCDIVVIALYPGDVITWCRENFPHMKPGTLAVDCAGVKTAVCSALPALAARYGLQFIGGHPMAGIECSGFENAFAGLFDGATMILCEDGDIGKATLERLGAFFIRLGFGSIKLSTAQEHDRVIAYTSQLAHLVSSAYIKSETVKRRRGFSAGSFKDLTRVAKLNADMWAELFFENRENLLKETDLFLAEAAKYREALAAGNRETLRTLLKAGSEIKTLDEEDEKKWMER